MPDYKTINLYKGTVEILFDDSLDAKGEKKHAYYLKEDGKMKRLAGVTTYIGILDKPALINWAVNVTVDFLRIHLDYLKTGQLSSEEILRMAKDESNRIKNEAGDLGSAIHKWIEEYISGNNPPMPQDDRVITGVNAFLDWLDEVKAKFIWSEKVLYSKKHKFVGTGDFGVKIGAGPLKGLTLLGDIKTGNSIYEEVKMQTAAYKSADEEEAGKKLYDGRIVLRVSKESEDEYIERMEKKGKNYPPYQVFEAVYLDNDPGQFDEDFKAFLNCMSLYRWKQAASKFKN
jgi:hypothetical protein